MIVFRNRWFLQVAVLVAFLTGGATFADTIKDTLDAAKATYSKAEEQANTSLKAAFDIKITILSEGGDLDAVEALIAQRTAFIKSNALPAASSMRAAVAVYKDALASSDLKLKAAYETAIADYTKVEDFDDAILTKRLMGERFPSVAPATQARTATAVSTTMPADTILDALQLAKRDFVSEVKQGQTELLAVIEKRANDAANKGDLDRFKRYNALEAVVLTDFLVPGDFKDTVVQGANAKFIRSAETAYAKLRTAYQTAISNYTKARKIEQAEAVKAEMVDGGWFENFSGRPSSVDLLRNIDIQKDTVRRGWRMERGILVSTGSDVEYGPLLSIPVSATGRYELDFQFSLPLQTDGLYILFPAGDTPALLEVRSGMQGISGSAGITAKMALPLRKSVDAALRVTPSDSNSVKIELILNGHVAISWEGPSDRVKRGTNVWNTGGGEKDFGIAGNGSVTAMQLRTKGF